MGKFASDTSVSVEKSRAEIERILSRYGAACFGYYCEPRRALIQFQIADRRIQFILPIPDKDSKRYTEHSRGQRTDAARWAMWEQDCRQRWRALCLVIKAKLEAVDCGITTLEEEFLAHIVLPDGRTVGQAAIPAIAEVYATGLMPRGILMLPEPHPAAGKAGANL